MQALAVWVFSCITFFIDFTCGGLVETGHSLIPLYRSVVYLVMALDPWLNGLPLLLIYCVFC